MCEKKTNQSEQNEKAGKPPAVSRDCADGFLPINKGTITSLVMIASSLCNYTILNAAAKMSATAVILMNVVITVIGVVLALLVNLRYGKLLAHTEK